MTKPKSAYLVPTRAVEIEEIIKKSRFITALSPARSVEAARAVLDDARRRFPDATHHCHAWIVGKPGATTDVKANDDGEPHGTAGKPMLAVLEGQGVGDVVVVVTRYFGGTKLGRGGLIRAYGGGVKTALEAAEVGPLIAMARLTVSGEYSHLARIKHLCSEHHVSVTDESFTDHVELTLELPEEQVEGFREILATKVSPQLEIVILQEH